MAVSAPEAGRGGARRADGQARAQAQARGSAAKGTRLEEAGLAPHRVRRFKLSTDPAFAEKLEDVVGLYVDPPRHAIVLSLDEKSQVQALDRPQPGSPQRSGVEPLKQPRLIEDRGYRIRMSGADLGDDETQISHGRAPPGHRSAARSHGTRRA